jgi:hypothetical protein
VANHEYVGCSEHQSRPSKGVIAKVVQLLKLAARFCVAAMEKATAAVAFPRGLSPGLERGAAFRKGKAASAALFDPAVRKWNGDGGFCFLSSVTGTVSISRVANRVGENGRFFARIPDVAVTGAACTRNFHGGTKRH